MSRYDHTMVFHNNKLYVFGGVVNQNYITNELWSLDMNSLKWTLEFENDNSSLALPMAVAGHTAHVIGNEMHVLFGYNPYEGYLYQVQIYSF
uniref:Attractin/MKLN-like beta-propeller domain-containing protein n=1 Tax=Acrobeloides nanus TaxID=290746 RepID=A0A914DA50_9BILA